MSSFKASARARRCTSYSLYSKDRIFATVSLPCPALPDNPITFTLGLQLPGRFFGHFKEHGGKLLGLPVLCHEEAGALTNGPVYAMFPATHRMLLDIAQLGK